MSDDDETQGQQASELEREERRLERLRLIATSWPTVEQQDEDPPTAA